MQGNQPGPYSYPIGVPQQPQSNIYPQNMMMMGPPQMSMNKNQLDIGSCLYVTDFGPYETEQSLFLHFSKFGNLKFVKIPRSCSTKPTKYAFVYFSSRDEAIKVKKLAHYSDLGGRELRVIHYKSMESAEKDFNNEANLFFKNVAAEISGKDVESYFSNFGEVTSCKLAKDSNGESLRYGYIQFSSKDSALNCLDHYKETFMEINSPDLSVIQFIPRGQRPFEETTQNLYVKNLPIMDKLTMEKKLKDIFSEFGDVKSVVANKAKLEFMYAFICFGSSEEAQSAIEALNNSDPFSKGVNISVELAKPRIEASHDPTNMYTKNLKRAVGEPDLRSVFEKYGEIESIAVRTVENFNTRSAFIKFKSPNSASAMKMSSKSDLDIKALYEGEVYIETFKNKKEYNLLKRSKQIRTGMGANRMLPFYQMFNPQFMMNPMMMNPMGQMNQMRPGAGPGAMGMPMNPQMQQMQGQRRMPPPNQPLPPQRGGRGGYRGGMRGMPNMMPNNMGGRPMTKRPPQNPMGPNNPIQMAPPNMNQRPIGPKSGSFPRDVNYIRSHLSEFQRLDNDRKREILGEMVFPKVKEMVRLGDDLIPKITGMLIDFEVFDVDEILEMIQYDDKMLEKVHEAEDLINSE